MRNLKKILALVLALMMVLSVMVTASASFKDDADITHTEAVDVMVAAGILNGDEHGNFRPTDALERSAAAKLIAYLMLGENIDLVDQTETPFADVKLAHWASGYVAYVNELGIVVGDGEGNYNPDAPINGYSFAKMVLLALVNLGKADLAVVDPTAKLDANGDWKVAPLTGNYALKVRLAMANLEDDIDLLAGLEKISLNANLTREQAAQMVFNALNDTEILKDTYKLTPKTYVENGMNKYVWIYTDAQGKEVAATEPVTTDTYVESFGSGTALKDVMAALGITEKYNKYGENYYNTIFGGNTKKVLGDYVKDASTISLARSLDVYVTADGTYKMMYTTETLAVAKLGKEVTDKKDANYGLYAWDFNGTTTYAAKDAYTDGAYYLVVVGGGKLVAEPVLAEKVTGKVMSKGADYARIDGVKYTFKGEVTTELGKEYDLYLATDGTVLKAQAAGSAPVVETAETLVYVLGYYYLADAGTPAIPGEYDEYGTEIKKPVDAVKAHTDKYAQAIDMNGEIVTYMVENDTKDVVTDWVAVNALKAVTVKDGVATFTASEKSAVVAAPIEYDAKTAIVKFVIGEDNYYITGAEYVEINGIKGKVTVGTGSQAGAAANTGKVWAFFTGDPAKTNNLTVTKVIYWNGVEAEEPEVEPSTDMYVLAGANGEYITTNDVERVEIDKNEDGKIADSEKLDIYTHKVMINGKVVEIKTEAQTIEVVGPASYKVDKYGYYYGFEAYANQKSGTVTNLYGTLATFAGYEDYDIAEVPVIDLTEDGNGTVEQGEEITVIHTNKGAVTLIYITKSVKPAE